MRVAILTQYYPPEVGAPQGRLSSLARRLVERGHEVSVVTAMPSYPAGRIQPGYGGLFRSERRDGVLVLRSWVVPTKSPSMAIRLLNYGSFVLSSLVVGLVKLPKVDVLITESPPLFLGVTGFILSRAKGARWVFNVSDLWPDVAITLGVTTSKALIAVARRLERFCYRHAWLVSGQTRGIVDAVAKRSPRTPTHFFPNGADEPFFTAQDRRDGTVCMFVYAGLHGLVHGLDQIVDALAELGPRDDVRVDFVGDGPEKDALIERARTRGVTSIRFDDPVAHDRIPAVLHGADVAIIPLRSAQIDAVPTKMYEAMAAGLPVLLVAEGEAVPLLRRAGAGVVVAPGDVHGLAKAMDALAADPSGRRAMGDSGRAFAREHFQRRRINDAFIDALEPADAR